MTKSVLDKIYIVFSSLFIFVFFFIGEWRWQLILIGIPDFRPYIVATILSAIVIVLGIFRTPQSESKNFCYWVVATLIIYYFSIEIIDLINNPELLTSYYKKYGIVEGIAKWCNIVALFIIASTKKVWQNIYRHSRLVKMLYIIYALFPLFILFMSGEILESHFNLRKVAAFANVSTLEHSVLYQTFGDKLACIGFVVLSFNMRKSTRIVIFAVSIASLYMAGSKASMVGFMFACLAYYWLSLCYGGHYIKCTALLVIAVALIISGLVYVVDNSSLQLSDNWLLSTIARGRDDISVSSRHIIEINNQETRDSRWVLGDYKFDYKFGRPGTYTHSAWGIVDYYGILIFIVNLILWSYMSFKLLFQKFKHPITSAALMSMLFYTLLFSIARFPTETYLWYWVLGFSVCALHYEKASRRV